MVKWRKITKLEKAETAIGHSFRDGEKLGCRKEGGRPVSEVLRKPTKVDC